MSVYKKKIAKRDMPSEFEPETVKTISRIEAHQTVIGIMYLRNDVVDMYTVPETMAQTFSAKLPSLNAAMHRALTEINLLKDHRDEWLVRTTALINTVNPMVDRIMEDESVEGVIMTNKEGAPILTNVSLTRATNYGLGMHRFGTMTQTYIKELDPFDEILVIRVNTKKIEIMVAPDPEFNLIVIQHARHKIKDIKKKK